MEHGPGKYKGVFITKEQFFKLNVTFFTLVWLSFWAATSDGPKLPEKYVNDSRCFLGFHEQYAYG